MATRIDKKNIMLILRVRNEAEQLEWFLDHHQHFYDMFIAIVDRCTDDSYDILRKHPQCAAVLEKVKDCGYSHQKDHNVLHSLCQYYPHDWWWKLDADERVCQSFLNEMNELPNGVVKVAMRFLTMFNDGADPNKDEFYEHFIIGGHTYANIYAIPRLFRRVERDGVLTWNDSPAYIANALCYHYHMLFPHRRKERYLTYIEHNPEGFLPHNIESGYRHIVNVEGARHISLRTSDDTLCQTRGQLYQHLKSMNLEGEYREDADKICKLLLEEWLEITSRWKITNQ